MTQRDYPDPPQLGAVRDAELRRAERDSVDSFEAYWAGSASASVMRDYAADRVSTHRARRAVRRPGR